MSDNRYVKSLDIALRQGKVSCEEILQLIQSHATPIASDVPPVLPLSQWDVEEPILIVEDLLVEGCVHAWAGLFESYKSMFAMELAHGVTTGAKVANHFKVKQQCDFLNLCLDMSPSLQLKYAKYFGLHENARYAGFNPKFEGFLALESPELRSLVGGKVLTLDTMLDWANVKDAFQSNEWIVFFQKLRNLMKRDGCKAIILICHPTKSAARDSVIDPSAFLKDSVTFGGKIDIGLAFRKVDNTSLVFIERIKGRGFEKPITFTVATHDEQGNSHISKGSFPICNYPKEKLQLSDLLKKNKRRGPKPISEKDDMIEFVKALPVEMSSKEKVKLLNEKFDANISASTVRGWDYKEKKAKEIAEAAQMRQEEAIRDAAEEASNAPAF